MLKMLVKETPRVGLEGAVQRATNGGWDGKVGVCALYRLGAACAADYAVAGAAWQVEQRPQNVTSATWTANPSMCDGVKHGLSPITQSTSSTVWQFRQIRWWWLSPTRVS